VWSLSSPSNQAAEWAAVVVGVLVFIAPWVIGFTSLTPIAWSAWIAGLLGVVLGGWVLLSGRGRPALAG